MATSAVGAVPQHSSIFSTPFFSKLKTFAKVVAKLALSIISGLGAALVGALLLPVKFHAALLPAAAAIAGVLFFRSYRKPSPPIPPAAIEQTLPIGAPRGIVGGVNNCWLHSGLQLLRSITPVYNWLQSEEIPPELQPFRDFYRVYEQATEKTSSVVVEASSQPLREILAELSHVPPHGTQEDIEEGIIDTILNRMPDALKVQEEVTTYYEETEAVRVRLIPLHPPKIKLNVPETENPTVQEMLENYSTEVADRKQKDKIEGQEYTPVRRETRFLQAPLFLLLQIERSKGGDRSFKIQNKKKLEIPPEIALQDFGCAYRLKAAIYHDGGTRENGHYTALTKGKDGKNYVCDDGHVISSESLRSSAVCMLHYERVPNQPN